jgi:hypothetical protein
MLLNGTISAETFYYNLQRGEIARPMVPFEEEQVLIEDQQAQQPLAVVSQRGVVNGTNGIVTAR